MKSGKEIKSEVKKSSSFAKMISREIARNYNQSIVEHPTYIEIDSNFKGSLYLDSNYIPEGDIVFATLQKNELAQKHIPEEIFEMLPNQVCFV